MSLKVAPINVLPGKTICGWNLWKTTVPEHKTFPTKVDRIVNESLGEKTICMSTTAESIYRQYTGKVQKYWSDFFSSYKRERTARVTSTCINAFIRSAKVNAALCRRYNRKQFKTIIHHYLIEYLLLFLASNLISSPVVMMFFKRQIIGIIYNFGDGFSVPFYAQFPSVMARSTWRTAGVTLATRKLQIRALWFTPGNQPD